MKNSSSPSDAKVGGAKGPSFDSVRLGVWSSCAFAAATLGACAWHGDAISTGLAGALVVTLGRTAVLSERRRSAIFSVGVVLDRAARGDLDGRVVLTRADGPAQAMCNNMNAAMDSADAFVREATAAMQAVHAGRFHRRLVERGMSGAYRRAAGTMNGIVLSLKERIGANRTIAERFKADLSGVVSSLSGCVERTRSGSASVAKDAEDVSGLVSDTSSSLEACAASIALMGEAAAAVARSMQEAGALTKTADAASEEAERESLAAKEIVSAIVESVQRIGSVATAVRGIAHQTRMLSLNATIEAERAGESGKGFAVVAEEVKSLAATTDRSVREITQLAKDIIASVERGTGAIDRIALSMEGVHRAVSEASSLVSSTASLTEDLSSNARSADAAISDASERMQAVSAAASSSGAEAGALSVASEDLGRASGDLDSRTQAFLSEVEI